MNKERIAIEMLMQEMEYVLSCINKDKIPFDGDDFHEALRLGEEVLAQPLKSPQRLWVGLTQTEVVDLLCEYNKLTGNIGWQHLIYMTEAKLKAKNERLEYNND